MAQRKVLLVGENSGASSAVGKSKEPATASVKRETSQDSGSSGYLEIPVLRVPTKVKREG